MGPDVQKLCVVTNESTIFKTSTKVFQIVRLSLNLISLVENSLHVDSTDNFKLAANAFLLNLTDSLTFKCVFLIDYIFISCFVLFL